MFQIMQCFVPRRFGASLAALAALPYEILDRSDAVILGSEP